MGVCVCVYVCVCVFSLCIVLFVVFFCPVFHLLFHSACFFVYFISLYLLSPPSLFTLNLLLLHPFSHPFTIFPHSLNSHCSSLTVDLVNRSLSLLTTLPTSQLHPYCLTPVFPHTLPAPPSLLPHSSTDGRRDPSK